MASITHVFAKLYSARTLFQIECAITTCDAFSFSLRCGGNDTAIIAHRVNAHQFAEAFNFGERKLFLSRVTERARPRAASRLATATPRTYDPINFPYERKPAVRQAHTLSVIVQRAKRTVIYPCTSLRAILYGGQRGR